MREMEKAPTYEANRAKYGWKAEPQCARCARPVKDPAIWVHFHNGGLWAVTPEEAADLTAKCPEADMGFSPLGADCARRLGVLWRPYFYSVDFRPLWPYMERVGAWAAETFRDRTALLAKGEGDPIDWGRPDSRVRWSEVCARFPGLSNAATETRVEFQTIFEKYLKAHGLTPVLRGKINAGQWAERVSAGKGA